MVNNLKIFRKIDLLIIFAIALIATFFLMVYNVYYNQNEDVSAEILVNGKICKKIELNENKIFSLDEVPNVKFEVKDGQIHFLSSDCPDKVCIRSGFLKVYGQMAACLPNKISIRIVKDKKDNEDFDIFT